MNSDSQKVMSLAFFLVGPAVIAMLAYSVVKGEENPVQAIQEARKPRTVLDDMSDMRLRYAEQKWKETILAARLVLKRVPGHEEALRTVADCNLKLKRPGEAAAAMEILLKDIPEDIALHGHYARALLAIGKGDEARKQWKIIEKSPYATRQEQREAYESLLELDGPLSELRDVSSSPPPRLVAPVPKDRVQ